MWCWLCTTWWFTEGNWKWKWSVHSDEDRIGFSKYLGESARRQRQIPGFGEVDAFRSNSELGLAHDEFFGAIHGRQRGLVVFLDVVQPPGVAAYLGRVLLGRRPRRLLRALVMLAREEVVFASFDIAKGNVRRDVFHGGKIIKRKDRRSKFLRMLNEIPWRRKRTVDDAFLKSFYKYFSIWNPSVFATTRMRRLPSKLRRYVMADKR